MQKINLDYDTYVQIQTDHSDWSYNSAWGDQMAEAMEWWLTGCGTSGSILDIGCGEGRGVAIAQSRGFQASGIDISKPKVDHGHTQDLDLYRGDFHKLPFTDKFFDYSFFSHAIEHAIDAEVALKEMVRVTKKKGFLIVPIEPGKTKVGEQDPHTYFFKDEEEWKALCDKVQGVKFEHTSRQRLGKELWTVFYVEESNS